MKEMTPTLALLPLHAFLKGDVLRDKPELTDHVELDLTKLDKVVKTRGVRILLEDLPAIGKAFDKGLSSGVFRIHPKYGSLEKSTILLTSLIKCVFTTDGILREAADINTIFYIRQACYMFKKVKVQCPKENVRKTVREFLLIEESLRTPSVRWDVPSLFLKGTNASLDDGDLPLFSHEERITGKALHVMQRVADVLATKMPEPNVYDMLPRHGPGAVSDLNKTRTWKYEFPCWPSRLNEAFPYGFFVNPRGDLWSPNDEPENSDEVPGRLLSVPKTFSKPRLITAEPTANQFCQQALLKYLRQSMPHVLRRSVNFKSQEPSRLAALEASMGNGKVTVDLSSASDRLTCWTVERVFRRNPTLLYLLASSRTRYVVDGTGSEEFQLLALRKFAGQGSAVTFPIQTLVYTIMAITAVLLSTYGFGMQPYDSNLYGKIKKAAREVRIFGDDMIVPEKSLWFLDILVSHLQLKINLGKTHYQGSFRESCGMDAYQGFEVTPVYLSAVCLGKGAEDLLSWIDTSNLAHKAGLWSLSTWMDGQVDPKVNRIIPISRQSDSYSLARYTFTNGSTINGRKRYDKYLHQPVGLALVVTTDEERVASETDKMLLQYFTEYTPVEDSFLEPSLADWASGHIVSNCCQLDKQWVPLL
jgi:hypothetical protein